MRDPVLIFRQIGIDIGRYAVHSNPWTDRTDGRFELSCLECRDRDLPLVIGEWTNTSLFSILLFVNRHEKEAHPKVTASKSVA